MPKLRLIPIAQPGGGFSYELARTDAEENAARKKAAAHGLLAGEAMMTRPNPQFWSFVDTVKSR